MSTGKLGEEFDQHMSFRLNVSQFRRRKLLESIMSENRDKQEEGSQLMNNFRKQVISRPELKETLNEAARKGPFSTSGINFQRVGK
jgi:hypothetical protein